MLDENHQDHIRLLISCILGFFSAITLAQWVLVSTLIYTTMQIGLLIPRYVEKFRNRKKRRPVNDA